MALVVPAVAHSSCAVLQEHEMDSSCVVVGIADGGQAAGTGFVVDEHAAGVELVVALPVAETVLAEVGLEVVLADEAVA